MKKLKKLISIFIVIVMMLTIMPLISNNVYAAAIVALQASPETSAEVNTDVTFKISTQDLDPAIYKNPEYLIWAYPGDGSDRFLITANWTSDTEISWKPDKVGKYDIKVYVQPSATDVTDDPKNYRVVGDLNYEIREKGSDPGGDSSDFIISNPYDNTKKYPYRVSMHTHSKWTPNYDHTSNTTDEVLKAYRDLPGTPKYGAVAITEHSRITTPDNTNPTGTTNPPWGVDNIVWIPGVEQWIGDLNGKYGNIFGEMCAVNVSTETTNDIAKNDEFSKNGVNYAWIPYPGNSHTYYTRQLDGKHAYKPYNPREVSVYAQMSFSGTGISWVANKGSYGGKVDVFIDGTNQGTIDLYSQNTEDEQEVFKKDDLTDGNHIIKLVLRDEAARTDIFNEISVNSFIVTKSDETKNTIYGDAGDTIVYGPEPAYYKDNFQHELYTPEYIIQNLQKDGAFVTVNHPKARRTTPEWQDSGWTKEELDKIFGDGNGNGAISSLPNAMEIGNANYDLSDTTSYTNAEEEWDYVLSKRKKVWGIAGDDEHEVSMAGKGWVVAYTNAASQKDLTKEDIMDSLFKGNFYASQGPNFNDIKVDGNKITVTGDSAGTIEFIAKGGNVVQKFDNVTTASYEVKGTEGYVRVKFTREDTSWDNIGGGIGRKRSAWTNPFFIQSPYSVDIQGDDNLVLTDNSDKTLQLKANVKYKGNGVTEDVVWSLKDAPQDGTVAIDNSGNLKVSGSAKSCTVTVIATLKKDGTIAASKSITIKRSEVTNIGVTGVTLDKSNIKLNIDGEQILKAIVAPDNASNKNVKWTSSNPAVATVDDNGKVKAVSDGEADITAITEDGNYKVACKVTVTNEFTLPNSYIIVGSTVIEMGYANAHPEVVVNEINKFGNANIYVSTDLSSQLYNGSMITGIKKLIDEEHPDGKPIAIAEANVSYTKPMAGFGYFTVKINKVYLDATYFSLASEDNEKSTMRYQLKAGALGETIPIFFFDSNKKLVGKGTVKAYPDQQALVIEILQDANTN